MKEFWVYKNDGSTYIEYANDISDIYMNMSNISRIECVNDNDNKQDNIDDEELEKYYSKYFSDEESECNIEKECIPKEVKILEKLKDIANTSNIISKWDKNFIFGALRSKDQLSEKQKNQIQKLQTKYSA